MSSILLDIQGEVCEVKRSELKSLSIIKLSTEGVNVTLELPQDLLQIKEKTKIRFVISTNEDIEQEVDGLFLCTIYKVERQKRGKEESTMVFGSIGGLQVRIEGKGLHRKIKMGDKVFIGIEVL
ncbi:MAG: DNA-directed RNA polymerase subunit G [Candidatus Nezhaarchaeales archaeon]